MKKIIMFLLIVLASVSITGCNKGDKLKQVDVTVNEAYETTDISETETEIVDFNQESPSPALTGESAVENKAPTPTPPTPRTADPTEDSNKSSYKMDYPEPEEKTITVNGISYSGMVYSDGVIYAVFDGKDTLTFVGNGAISDREDWCGMSESSRRKVRHIVIEKGITYIDELEFCGDFLRPFINLESVRIEADLIRIGYGAFTHNPCLKKVVVNGECQDVDDRAFDEGITIE